MSDGTTPRADVTGIILAGGRSSRFGTDKLIAELDGRPLLHRALLAVAGVAGPLIVVSSPNVQPTIPKNQAARVRIVHDPEPYGGPLVGLVAALSAVETPIALVAGGDMPRMIQAVLRRLASTVGPERRAVILEVPGRIQSLPMAVDTGAALLVGRATLQRGGRSLRELLVELGSVAIPAPVWLSLDPAGQTIDDIDRPADLRS